MSTFFFAASEDLTDLLLAIFQIPGITAYQTYSIIDQPLITCLHAQDALSLISSGETQLSFWTPSVMSAPNIRAISLVSGGKRFTAEGCGLFSLHVGYSEPSLLCVSSLTWFTEAGARAKCSVKPGPESVDWTAHKKLGAKLQSLVRRKFQAASVSGRSILAEALRAHQQGMRLKEHKGSPYQYSISSGKMGVSVQLLDK